MSQSSEIVKRQKILCVTNSHSYKESQIDDHLASNITKIKNYNNLKTTNDDFSNYIGEIIEESLNEDKILSLKEDDSENLIDAEELDVIDEIDKIDNSIDILKIKEKKVVDDFIINKSNVLNFNTYILKHPFVSKEDGKSNQINEFLFDSKNVWNNKDRVIISNIEDHNINDLLNKNAIMFVFNPEWDNVPNWLINFIINKNRKASVWLKVEYEDLKNLNEEWLRKSIQLGWSWWLTPPTNINDFNDFLNVNKDLWRFWFKNQLSDQWVFPWCNIFTQQLISKENPNISVYRNWVSDHRHKSAWLKIENEAFVRIADIFGGENAIKNMYKGVEYWNLTNKND